MINTQNISIELPKDVFLAINEDEKTLKKEIKILLAVKLYLFGKLTIGKASELAELSKTDFEKLLSENKIPISLLTYEDVLKDSEKLI